MPIIQSLLDTDLYKFTMMQAVLHQHPGAQVQYRFKCRTPGIDLARYIDQIDEEIDHLCSLRSATRSWITCVAAFREAGLRRFLGLFHLDRKYIQLRASKTVPGEIELDITGPWLHTILFEVPLLAIINEVWFRNTTTADLPRASVACRPRPRCCVIPRGSSSAASPTMAAAAGTRATGTPGCCRCCAMRSARSWSVPATCTSPACTA